MLDRAGFSGAEGIFRIEGDVRHERAIFDFATGSGGFLVEAARRVIDEAGMVSRPRATCTRACGRPCAAFTAARSARFPTT